MLEFKFIVDNKELVKERLSRRGSYAIEGVDKVVQLNETRIALQKEGDSLRHKQKSTNLKSYQPGSEEFNKIRDELKACSQRIKDIEKEEKEVGEKIREILLTIPNMPSESTPIGKDDSDSRFVRAWGEKPVFNFTPLPHWDVGEKLGIFDFERAGKISGSRFVVLYGMGSKLERALINFMLDTHTNEHGYREVLPPFIVNNNSMTGTGQLPKFAQDLFKLENTDYYLIPTAEVPVTNLHAGEILKAEELPIKYAAYTPCFRSEAGSYGKDVRGIIRQHQFDKVELVKFVNPLESYNELELLVKDAEEILQKLNLHYRVVELCSGDIGFSAAKCYDLEVWLPSQDKYREISSCSNFESFQARRANIRFRSNDKPEFIHTLNGSGIAVGRTMVAILEQNQQADGSVIIPEALRSYMKCDIIRPSKS